MSIINIIISSKVFRKYAGISFEELEKFAQDNGFRIVDRYWTPAVGYPIKPDPNRMSLHIPAIEVF